MSSSQNSSSGFSSPSGSSSGSSPPLETSDRLPPTHSPAPAPAAPPSGNGGRFAFSFHFPGTPAVPPGDIGTDQTAPGTAEGTNGVAQPPPLTITMEFGFGPPQPVVMPGGQESGGGILGARVQEGAPGFRMEGLGGGNPNPSPSSNQPDQTPIADQPQPPPIPGPALDPFSMLFGPPPTLPGNEPPVGLNPAAFIPFTPNADGNPQAQFNLPWLFFQQAAGLRRPSPPDPARAQELLKGLKDPGADLMRRIDRVVKAENGGEGFRCAVCMEGWEEDVEELQMQEVVSGDVNMERQPSLASEGSMGSEQEVEKVVLPSMTKDTDEAAMDPEGGKTGMKVFPCCHVFHTDCLEPWLRSKTTCPTCRFDIDPLSTTLRRTDSNRARFNPLRPQATQNTNTEQRGRPYAARPANSGAETPNIAASGTATPAGGAMQAAEGGMFGPRGLDEPPFSFFHPMQPQNPATPQGNQIQSTVVTDSAGTSTTGQTDTPANPAQPPPTETTNDPPLLATFHFSLIPEPLGGMPQPAIPNSPTSTTNNPSQRPQTPNTDAQPAASANVAPSNAPPPGSTNGGFGFDVPTAFLLAMRTANRIMSSMGGPAGAIAFATQHAAHGGNGSPASFGPAPHPPAAADPQAGPVPESSNASLSNSSAAPNPHPAPPGSSLQRPPLFSLFLNTLPTPAPLSQAPSPSADAGGTGATSTPAARGPGMPHPTQPSPSRRKKWIPPAGKLTLDEWVTLREKALHWRCDHPVCMFAPPEHLDDVLPGEWDNWKPSDEACMPLISMGQRHVVPPNTEGAFNLLACGHSFHTSCVRTGALVADWWTKDEDGRRLCRCPRCRKDGWMEEPEITMVAA